ncbi:MAG: hypothetical protein UU18_C0032G0005 [Parcubacteria group bacterium GW2011_GWB2_40_8]|nr:MAG: hypothetical protein UT71_C0017G0018 [Parcubacteria group bacterium GW2011_GWF2_40_10]KKR47510.1 MAG: hypothetical protein UT83_C0008G0018 [Parcubacteria group bacterium GW2011_GWA2_40_143]KKR59929.1 MAG: hypothetical protein UT97_C0008G0019 [Parcubacteria group bacterium GW2011_GWC2_40_31]KKR74216.1 MAG: hypothetical protein UU18_C0032G0005 [Parcubacteria group bacterium GW2011_GWB2_40_8]KKR75433.1 MAG: hypothetical protein UU20_C0054G0003 [Parcubacteria group bacterium GW2011_GWE2_40_
MGNIEIIFYEPDQNDLIQIKSNLDMESFDGLNCTACDCQCACDCGSCYP